MYMHVVDMLVQVHDHTVYVYMIHIPGPCTHLEVPVGYVHVVQVCDSEGDGTNISAASVE